MTISLIISEDENGQKRTQVIIPTTDNLKCDICNRSFKTSFQLLKHNRLKHAREEDITTRNFPCDSCPKRLVKNFSWCIIYMLCIILLCSVLLSISIFYILLLILLIQFSIYVYNSFINAKHS